MSYDKSDGSRRYNREERGGWYCTNPQKHDEGSKHHAQNEKHDHHAERNDNETHRNEGGSAHYERQPSRNERMNSQPKKNDSTWRPMSTTPPKQNKSSSIPSNPEPAKSNSNENLSDKFKNQGCGCIIKIIVYYIILQIVLAILAHLFS